MGEEKVYCCARRSELLLMRGEESIIIRLPKCCPFYVSGGVEPCDWKVNRGEKRMLFDLRLLFRGDAELGDPECDWKGLNCLDDLVGWLQFWGSEYLNFFVIVHEVFDLHGDFQVRNGRWSADFVEVDSGVESWRQLICDLKMHMSANGALRQVLKFGISDSYSQLRRIFEYDEAMRKNVKFMIDSYICWNKYDPTFVIQRKSEIRRLLE